MTDHTDTPTADITNADGIDQVFALREDLHMSYAEIADTLGIKMGTVMSRLHRARRRHQVQATGEHRSMSQVLT